jgi:hypothetical protein
MSSALAGDTPMPARGRRAVVSVLALAVACLAPPRSAVAQPYDGSRPMSCAVQTVMVCNDPAMCVRGTAATVNIPRVLLVDVPNRLISGAATGRTIQITAVDRGAGKTMLRGLDVQALGIAWDIVVDEASGAMVGAVLSQGGYLVFGRCSPP